MHGEKVIRRPTVGVFAEAAGYKWHNEIKVLAGSKTRSKRDKTFSTTTEEVNRNISNDL